MQSKGLNGRDANARARNLADDLLDYGIDLSRIDPREYARGGSGQRATGTTPAQPWMSPDVTERQNRQSAFLNQF